MNKWRDRSNAAWKHFDKKMCDCETLIILIAIVLIVQIKYNSAMNRLSLGLLAGFLVWDFFSMIVQAIKARHFEKQEDKDIKHWYK